MSKNQSVTACVSILQMLISHSIPRYSGVENYIISLPHRVIISNMVVCGSCSLHRNDSPGIWIIRKSVTLLEMKNMPSTESTCSLCHKLSYHNFNYSFCFPVPALGTFYSLLQSLHSQSFCTAALGCSYWSLYMM